MRLGKQVHKERQEKLEALEDAAEANESTEERLCECAFSKTRSLRRLSTQFKIDHRTVRRWVACGAEMFWTTQLMLLRWLVGLALSCE